jgi:hypothetical protein
LALALATGIGTGTDHRHWSLALVTPTGTGHWHWHWHWHWPLTTSEWTLTKPTSTGQLASRVCRRDVVKRRAGGFGYDCIKLVNL